MARNSMLIARRNRSSEDVRKLIAELQSHYNSTIVSKDIVGNILIDIPTLDLTAQIFFTDGTYSRILLRPESNDNYAIQKIELLFASHGWSRPDSKNDLNTLLCIAAIAIALWLVIPISVAIWIPHPSDPEIWATRGQVGDMFGIVNALFSALALAGVIYTIILQRRELGLQRLELEASRTEFMKTAKAQESAVQLNVLKEAFDYIRATHDARTYIFQNESTLKNINSLQDLIDVEESDQDIIRHVHEAANCYHYIGFLIKAGLLERERELLTEGGLTLTRVYNIIWHVIEIERKRGKNPGYKKYFYWLNDRANKYLANAADGTGNH